MAAAATASNEGLMQGHMFCKEEVEKSGVKFKCFFLFLPDDKINWPCHMVFRVMSLSVGGHGFQEISLYDGLEFSLKCSSGDRRSSPDRE